MLISANEIQSDNRKFQSCTFVKNGTVRGREKSVAKPWSWLGRCLSTAANAFSRTDLSIRLPYQRQTTACIERNALHSHQEA